MRFLLLLAVFSLGAKPGEQRPQAWNRWLGAFTQPSGMQDCHALSRRSFSLGAYVHDVHELASPDTTAWPVAAPNLAVI